MEFHVPQQAECQCRWCHPQTINLVVLDGMGFPKGVGFFGLDGVLEDMENVVRHSLVQIIPVTSFATMALKRSFTFCSFHERSFAAEIPRWASLQCEAHRPCQRRPLSFTFNL